ncbi:hypothetical protein QQ008_21635 [Fulvivirgaceae bacterium BMA10]|uniref:Uncharacterized protein n=1 Tax=Splendidivirga corallicola TaxID=3051826 RepID=A0ABT8KV37_9BACT|nr:hypothetical protein [Fulvivirgaceae bacterium BMA10]
MKTTAKIFLLLGCLVVGTFCFGQKTKLNKNPIGWSYDVEPKKALNPSLQRYRITVKTDLDPLSSSDETALYSHTARMDYKEKEEFYKKVGQDTIRKWSSDMLALKSQPFVENSSNPDFTISLITYDFKIDNPQLDIDYSDTESIVGEIKVTARLLVETAGGEYLLDEQLRYTIMEGTDEETVYLKLKHFLLDPTFKTKWKLTKKPEKKRKILERKLNKIQSVALKFFFEQSEEILRDNFLTNRVNAYSAIFGVKDKAYSKLNETGVEVSNAINSLSAFSKKKRQTLEQIKPTLESAVVEWKKLLEEISNPEIQKAINSNIATTSLILADMSSARTHLDLVPESKDEGKDFLFEGSFKYYVKGLADAVHLVETFQERSTIYTPQ